MLHSDEWIVTARRHYVEVQTQFFFRVYPGMAIPRCVLTGAARDRKGKLKFQKNFNRSLVADNRAQEHHQSCRPKTHRCLSSQSGSRTSTEILTTGLERPTTEQKVERDGASLRVWGTMAKYGPKAGTQERQYSIRSFVPESWDERLYSIILLTVVGCL